MILVVGGTGRVGRRVAEQLAARGAPVRVLTRQPATAGRVDGVDYVPGDLHDPASVAAALAGVDAVVCTAHGGEGGRDAGPRGIEGRALPVLVAAAGRAGVTQFVYVSSASARPDSPAAFFRGKAAVEAALRSSAVPHAILRPTHLLDTWVPMLAEPLLKKGQEMIIGAGRNPVSWVAGADVAAAAAALAGQPGDGSSTDLGGPDPLTLRELSTLVAAELGVAPAKTKAIGPGMLRFGSRVMAPFNELLSRQMGLGALLDTAPQVVDSGAAWSRLGLTPLPVAEWLDSTDLRAVVAA
jgi:uncharacterized protein YbjT (DUF2867 family)